jgi:hypothetical protein
MTHSNRASSSSPPAGDELDPDKPIETTEQLRIAIDQGHGGDKVDATDPAAAPLGTDDEAGGTPNSAAQVRLAAAHEIRARPKQKRQRTTGVRPRLVGHKVYRVHGSVNRRLRALDAAVSAT